MDREQDYTADAALVTPEMCKVLAAVTSEAGAWLTRASEAQGAPVVFYGSDKAACTWIDMWLVYQKEAHEARTVAHSGCKTIQGWIRTKLGVWEWFERLTTRMQLSTIPLIQIRKIKQGYKLPWTGETRSCPFSLQE